MALGQAERNQKDVRSEGQETRARRRATLNSENPLVELH